ncbi:unnamed protein product, partial [Mesorhabditis belari]|uniref:Amino acid transporter n=1 Tax=Mesorhabditis belari TaxID=2138241 RepID=A0AAF3F5H8_9BILA
MEETETEPRKHAMGFISCTSYVVGNIIGSGIFITPGSILEQTGSIGLSLAVWTGCGLVSILGSICYIELGTSIPDPGCDFAYTCFVKWHSLAFAFMWVSVLMTYPASAAVQAQTFGQYIVEGFSISLHGVWQEVVTRSTGFIVLALLTLLNFYSLEKYAARFQVVVTFAKMIAMAIIIFTGLYLLVFKGWTHRLDQPFQGSIWHPGPICLAFYGGLWSYAGWDVLNYGTPEIHKPRRTMPLALLTGILIVMITYILINLAYFVVLDVTVIKNSDAVAADFARAVLGNFRYAIPFMIAILLIGTLNSNIFVGSRYMQAAAWQGHLPPFISCIHGPSGSPRMALLCQSLLTIAISFVDTDSLINYVTFVMWAQRVVTMSALLWIKFRHIQVDPGAIRVPLVFSILFLVISIALVVVPLIQETKVTLIGIGIVLSGLLFYYPFVHSKHLPLILSKVNDWATQSTERFLFSERNLRKAKQLNEVENDEYLNDGELDRLRTDGSSPEPPSRL